MSRLENLRVLDRDDDNVFACHTDNTAGEGLFGVSLWRYSATAIALCRRSHKRHSGMPKEDSFHSQRTDRPVSYAETRMFKFFATFRNIALRAYVGTTAGHVMNDEASQRYQPGLIDPVSRANLH